MIKTNTTRSELNKKKKSRKWLWGLLIFFVSLIAAGFLYVKSTIDNMIQPTVETKPIATYKKENDYMLNFLLMGVDNDSEREKTGLDGTRTDSLMLITLNTKSEKITIYSIPRDTTTVLYNDKNEPQELSGQYVNKINAAYEFGGESATVNTVEHLFEGIDIDYYATVNFISFKGIVDSIDGIEVDVPEDIYNKDLDTILVKKGHQTLNGEQALDMARARYQDDDIHRGYRQQIVMEAIANKMLSSISPTKAIGIFNSINGNVRTNMSISDMTKLYTGISSKNFTFDKITADWGSFNADGSSMVYLPAQSRATVVTKINESIDRNSDTSSILNGNTYLQQGLNELENQIVNYGVTDVSYTYLNSLFNFKSS